MNKLQKTIQVNQVAALTVTSPHVCLQTYCTYTCMYIF